MYRGGLALEFQRDQSQTNEGSTLDTHRQSQKENSLSRQAFIWRVR